MPTEIAIGTWESIVIRGPTLVRVHYGQDGRVVDSEVVAETMSLAFRQALTALDRVISREFGWSYLDHQAAWHDKKGDET